ncbi:hypothetical protein AB0M43_21670 [Longispora sp. NPDC051575]|uniref:hypothetical protein n=1 Tax=Longispora sp. NPDC051575 TaxID=3154943 RepID=UPI00343BCE39
MERVDDTVGVLSLDFRQLGVGQRLTALRQFGPALVELSPQRVSATDVPGYVAALLGTVSIPTKRVVVVTYCAAFGLVGEIGRALATKGVEVVHVVAVDAVVPDFEDVLEAFNEVFRQFGTTYPDVEPVTATDVAGGLGRLLFAAMAHLSRRVSATLGTHSNRASATIADDLLARYETWLAYVLACYGASATPWHTASTLVCSPDRVGAAADAHFDRTIRCQGEPGDCACVVSVVEEIRVDSAISSLTPSTA